MPSSSIIQRMSPPSSLSLLPAALLAALCGCSSDSPSRPNQPGIDGGTGVEGGAGGNRRTGGTGGRGLIETCTGPYCADASVNHCVPSVTVKSFPIRRIQDYSPSSRHLLDTTSDEGDDECTTKTVTWTAEPDGGTVDAWTPPKQETYSCPAGTARIHVRELWSDLRIPRSTRPKGGRQPWVSST